VVNELVMNKFSMGWEYCGSCCHADEMVAGWGSI